jgi:hypothetical protein
MSYQSWGDNGLRLVGRKGGRRSKKKKLAEAGKEKEARGGAKLNGDDHGYGSPSVLLVTPTSHSLTIS